MIFVIIGLSMMSYITGIVAILKGDYKPSVYSRIIWLLIAANGLVGLVLLENSNGNIALSAVQTFGSLVIAVLALKHSVFTFGRKEWISSVLLLISLALWVLTDLPALNVAISLIAHFIGGIPTLVSVVKNPRSENTMFWGYFGVASIILVVMADKSEFTQYMFPLYFALFNSTVTLLSLPVLRRKH